MPKPIQEKADQKLALLVSNPEHPSLRLRKMEGYKRPNVWELSVTMKYRVTFEIHPDHYRLLKVGTHDILRHPR